jgi:hypothetical protein
MAQTAMILIPTILIPCFTVEEPIGVVNIDDLSKFVSEAIAVADGDLELPIPRNAHQRTILK